MAKWFSFGQVILVLMLFHSEFAKSSEVTYDGRSLIIGGQRKLLFSGSIHYPRSTPDMWPSIISKAKNGGLDVIETYVFWNLHEPRPGQYDFSGRKDIVRFIKEVQAQGLYACIRIGPYIESEWNYGGLPFWLHDVPGIVYRSDNEPFKLYMKSFTTYIVNLLKANRLYASQGGPIILSQIENEYRNVEGAFHEKGPPYVRWAAAMAVGLQTGVPWVMCKQDDAPDPIINACNGRQCGETWSGPNSPNKPAIWTENWTSWFQAFGGTVRPRSAEDIAFHTALFIAKKGGSFINYYMYHGGTNLERTASAFMTTAYYDDGPLNEYGLINQPKWGHLRDFHATIKSCSHTLLFGAKSNMSLGNEQEAFVFQEKSGRCAAFLVNHAKHNNVQIQFQNYPYQLPPASISILPDCKTVAHNTAMVSTRVSPMLFQPQTKLDSVHKWTEFHETVPSFEDTRTRADALLEHMNTTKDVSDYLWYTVSVERGSGGHTPLQVNSLGHVLHAFVNGAPVGSAHGARENPAFTLESRIHLHKGRNNISLLSATVGLPNSGAFLERRALGINRVALHNRDISRSAWGYQVGLLGERLQIYSDKAAAVQWKTLSRSPEPLTWYKTSFDAPKGDEPLTINLASMGKGQVWVNGQSIGRYWISFHTPAGQPSQTRYHIPRSFLRPSGNQLVLFEEETGNPLGIAIETVSIKTVRGQVPESSYIPEDFVEEEYPDFY